MVPARIFMLGDSGKPQGTRVWPRAVYGDLAFLCTVALLYANLCLRVEQGATVVWFFYHVLTLPLYLALVWLTATGQGIIAWMLASPLVSRAGQSSFYPYMLHMPVAAWICWLEERRGHGDRILFHPGKVVLFILLLYAGSALYLFLRGRRGPYRRSGPIPAPPRTFHRFFMRPSLIPNHRDDRTLLARSSNQTNQGTKGDG